MQYKTVAIEHPRKCKKNIAAGLNEDYEKVINNLSSQGWKLLGIHPIEVKRRKSCLEFLLFGILLGYYNYYQVDVLIFFKDY